MAVSLFWGITQPGTSQQLGIFTVGSTVYPTQGLRRVAKIVLSNTNYQGLYGAAIDAANGYAYWVGRNGSLSKINLTTFTEESTIVGLGQSYGSFVDDPNGFGYFESGANIYKVKLGGPAVLPILEATLVPGGNFYGGVIDKSNADPTKHYIYFIDGNKPATVYKYLLPSPSGGDLDNKLPTLVGSVLLNSPNFPTTGFTYHGVIDTGAGFAYFSGFNTNQIAKIALNGAGTPTEVGVITTTDPATTAYGFLPDIDATGATHYAYLGTYVPHVLADVVKINLTSFTEVSNATLNSGTGGCNGPTAMEQMLSAGLGDSTSGYTVYGTDGVFPMKVFKIKNNAGNLAPTENAGAPLSLLGGTSVPPCDGNAGVADASPDGGLTYPYGEVFAQGSVIDNGAGYAYFGTDSGPGQIIKVAFSQKAAIKGTKVVLAQAVTVNDLNFYSTAAGGHVRLAIYDNAATPNLLWDSGALVNGATGWITATIASGSPSSLTLNPGTYWLCWQVDTTLDIPSYSSGNPGDGFLQDQAFGAYPGILNTTQSTSETWSEYLDYTVSGATPSATASPTPTLTPTQTGTNTLTSTPTSTPSSTPTTTPSNSPTNTATNSPIPSPTNTGTLAPTNTATSSPTNTSTNTPSQTPTSTATNSLTPTASNSPSATATASLTNSPTLSPTGTASSTPTLTPTQTETGTPTNTLSATPTGSLTNTPTPAVTGVVIGLPYPNPIRGEGPLNIDVQGPSGTTLTWDVFTAAYRKIAGGSQPVSGSTTIAWDLTDKFGTPVANGLYYIRIKVTVGGAVTTKILKVLVLNH